MPAIPCSAIILAGGRATRLGGVDKALLPLAGQPMLAHVLARLAPQVEDIVISYNRDHTALAAFGCTLVADPSPDHAGPLTGIAAALPHCRHELIAVVPCDVPLLPGDLVQQLMAPLQADIDLVVADDGERLQPLVVLMRRRLLPLLQRYLMGGNRKVKEWIAQQAMTTASFESASAFANVNTAEELLRVEQSLLRQAP